MRTSPFCVGTVAILDALGVKGIWARRDPWEVIESLEWLPTFAPDQVLGDPFNALTISDTTVITMKHGSSEASPFEQMHALGSYISGLSLILASRNCPLALRGSVSFGEYYQKGNVILGPAVDEAAANYESANASMVWMTSSAHSAYQTSFPGRASVPQSNSSWIRTLVPLRGGRFVRTRAINWAKNAPFDHTAILNLIKGFDSPRSDVIEKRKHTVRFLANCIFPSYINFVKEPERKSEFRERMQNIWTRSEIDHSDLGLFRELML